MILLHYYLVKLISFNCIYSGCKTYIWYILYYILNSNLFCNPNACWAEQWLNKCRTSPTPRFWQKLDDQIRPIEQWELLHTRFFSLRWLHISLNWFALFYDASLWMRKNALYSKTFSTWWTWYISRKCVSIFVFSIVVDPHILVSICALNIFYNARGNPPRLTLHQIIFITIFE